MTATNAKKYRTLLGDMATRLGATVSGLEDQVRSGTGGEAAGGISNAPVHLADIGSETYSQELGATLLENEAFIRDEVLAALDRLDRGSFGTCERCGKGIAVARLDAISYARHCAPCATEIQSGKPVSLNDGRPSGWLGGKSTSRRRTLKGVTNDSHAAGTPGGGASVGGLAGTSIGHGKPAEDLEEIASGMEVEPRDEAEEEAAGAYAGRSGGAIGGSPANKRARGGAMKASSKR